MGILVICEKNDAAKQIAKALSDGKAKRRAGGGVPIYQMTWKGEETAVVGLRGHIVELDFVKGHSRWSIDADKMHALVDAGVQKDVTEDGQGIVKALQAEAKKAQTIIVATDYDREGELIGVEALEALGPLKGKTIRRAKYSSFTPKEVNESFDHLQDVDYKLAQAGEARQVIDLAWGAALTRYLSVAGGRRGAGFLSVGRVQTPTLGLIVAREKERMAFKPNDYWEVEAEMVATPQFVGRHERSGYVSTTTENPDGSEDEKGFSLDGKFKSWAEAQAAVDAIKKAGSAKVTDVKNQERSAKAPAPFSTTTFQSECSSQFGMGVKRAMDIAQRLYLQGFISYHRTENTVYPPTLDLNELVDILEKSSLRADCQWVRKNRRPEATRGKKETKDHPPIYATAVPTADAKLSDQDWKVWELIARRFLATLSPDARLSATSVKLEAGGEPLRASGQTTIFAGWRQVYPYSSSKENPLPALTVGQLVPVGQVRLDAKQTQPPKRYSQGSLIAKMEEEGIGTKATRHETLQKLIDRNYITENPVAPTKVGFAVTDALEEHANTITKSAMTHQLEEEMDGIEKGSRSLDETLADSRHLLHSVVDVLIANKEPISTVVRKAMDEDAHAGSCPECGKDLVVRPNRFGGRFIGCKGYPDCTTTYNVPARGKTTFRDNPCETCHAPFILHDDRGRKQEFCANPGCPTRAAAAELEKMELGQCPTCKHGTLQLTRSRNFKRFVKCDNPDCMAPNGKGAQTYPLPQRGALQYDGRTCETCSAPRILVITAKRKPWDICVNMDCPSAKKEEKPKKGEEAEGGTVEVVAEAPKKAAKPKKAAVKKGKGGAAA